VATSLLPPAVAHAVFGERLELASRYARWLAGAGVERGLVGPREAERLWQRHLLNCGAVAALIPPGSLVVDVGSGAGLPGIVLAIARPDLRIVLIESMLRRTQFLDEVVADLGLSSVTVRRARAEELRGERIGADVVTARALAPMAVLVPWAVPLLASHGVVLALKGDGVVDEISAGWGQVCDAGLATGVRLLELVDAVQGGRREGCAVDDPSFMAAVRVAPVGSWTAAGAFVPVREPIEPDADRLALVVRLQRYPQGSPSRPRLV